MINEWQQTPQVAIALASQIQPKLEADTQPKYWEATAYYLFSF